MGDDGFKERKPVILEEKQQIELQLNQTGLRVENWLKEVEEKFKTATVEEKREFVSIFCENLKLKDKNLVWEWKKPYYFWVKNAKSSNMLRQYRKIRTFFKSVK